MRDDKPGPWTIKLVEQADRDAVNAAARRAQQPVGPWLVEAAQQRIARERVQRLGRTPAARQALGGHEGTPAPLAPPACGPAPAGARSLAPAVERSRSPEIADLVLVLRELRDVPRCRQVLARARRLLAAQLDPAFSAPQQTAQALLSAPPAADD